MVSAKIVSAKRYYCPVIQPQEGEMVTVGEKEDVFLDP
jgi:hypothetical protein